AESATDQGEMISSTRIRHAIESGQVELANSMLTADYRIRGRVSRGDRRGREIGFPTANLVDCDVLLPGPGVFGGRAFVGDSAYDAALHLGPLPTFGQGESRAEVHLIGYSGDLYGRTLEVELATRIRDIERFDDVDALTRQLRHDVRQVKQWLQDHPRR
ncbi:MAG: riboflavin kinase, partial [Planctomycetota bacterium]